MLSSFSVPKKKVYNNPNFKNNFLERSHLLVDTLDLLFAILTPLKTKNVFGEVFLLNSSCDDIVTLVQIKEEMQLHGEKAVVHTTVYPAAVGRQSALHCGIRNCCWYNKALPTP